MIPETPSPEHNDPLDHASLTLIAAWRNGHLFPQSTTYNSSDPIWQLMPPHITNLTCRAVFQAAREYEAYPQDRSFENIVACAQAELKLSDEEWQAFWARVEALRPVADEAAMNKAAAFLRETHDRIQREQDDASIAEILGTADGGGQTSDFGHQTSDARCRLVEGHRRCGWPAKPENGPHKT